MSGLHCFVHGLNKKEFSLLRKHIKYFLKTGSSLFFEKDEEAFKECKDVDYVVIAEKWNSIFKKDRSLQVYLSDATDFCDFKFREFDFIIVHKLMYPMWKLATETALLLLEQNNIIFKEWFSKKDNRISYFEMFRGSI